MSFGRFLKVDYKSFGVLTIFVFYLFRDSKFNKSLAFLLLTYIHYLVRYKTFYFNIEIWKSCIFTMFPFILICLYNGKLGRKFQKFYYWFYPVHLLVFYLIGNFII